MARPGHEVLESVGHFLMVQKAANRAATVPERLARPPVKTRARALVSSTIESASHSLTVMVQKAVNPTATVPERLQPISSRSTGADA